MKTKIELVALGVAAILMSFLVGARLESPLHAQQYFPGVTYQQTTLTAASTALTGTCTTASCLSLPTNNAGSVAWQFFSAAASMVVAPEGTVDGVHWSTLTMTPYATVAMVPVLNYTPTTTATGIYVTNTAGLNQVRLHCTTFTSGSLLVTGQTGSGVPVLN
jgi:hypothetical protein